MELDVNLDLADLELWLREDGYAETTVQNTIYAGPGILRRCAFGEEVAVTAWPVARRLARYARERSLPWANDPNLVALGSNDTARASERQCRTRKLEAKSFDDGAWRRLARGILDDQSREARVLELIMFSGLRAGDALRITQDAAVESLETGRLELIQKGQRMRPLLFSGPDDPLRESLERALRQWRAEEDDDRRNSDDMTGWIVPGSAARLPLDSARHALSTVLHRIGQSVNLRGRIHLHRMRRTIAVQALRDGADVMAVGQLLGHRPGSRATLGYIDEARLEDVANLRRNISKKHID